MNTLKTYNLTRSKQSESVPRRILELASCSKCGKHVKRNKLHFDMTFQYYVRDNEVEIVGRFLCTDCYTEENNERV